MLKSENFNVLHHRISAKEGVDLGKLYDYDIILLDLNLPDMSGYEVLRTLRVAKVKTPIPYFIRPRGHRRQSQGLGLSGPMIIWTKPFHKDDSSPAFMRSCGARKGHAQSSFRPGISSSIWIRNCRRSRAPACISPARNIKNAGAGFRCAKAPP